MANSEIDNYINKRYNNWLDYSMFHCKKLGISDESIDVLNEVLVSLLQKDDEKIIGLLHRIKDGCTELDFYVLRMIKLNVQSSTSPYRQKWKFNKIIDTNVNVFGIELEDVSEYTDDVPERILQQMNAVRKALDDLEIDVRFKDIFSFHFFQGESFSDWKGEEGIRKLYDVYNQVLNLIKWKINGEIIF